MTINLNFIPKMITYPRIRAGYNLVLNKRGLCFFDSLNKRLDNLR